MNKKINSVILALLMMFTFSACQLAREENINQGKDKLIGVYVTYEHLDLFDIEGYLNDNLNAFNGKISVSGDANKYNGRLYATKKETEKTSSQGEKYTGIDYVFEDIEGFGMYSATMVDPLYPDNTYMSSSGDMGFTDTKFHVKHGDEQDGIELSGILYVPSGAMSKPIYINPVYQSENGEVYLLSGSGFHASGDNGEGGVYTQKMEEKITIKENGKTKTFLSKVETAIATINPTIKVGILQMDKDSNVIKKEEYSPKNMAIDIKPEPNTEYIVLEATKQSYDKSISIERTLFSKKDNMLWYFKTINDKILTKGYTNILWEGQTTNNIL